MIAVGGTFWEVVARDAAGHPIELRQIKDVAAIVGPDGEVDGYHVGCHPSRALHPMQVIFKPEEPPTLADHAVEPRGHHCAALAALDCYAVAGDSRAASLARFHAAHPNGPQTPEEYAEEAALRAGFVRRTVSA